MTEKTSFPAQEMTVGARSSNAAEALGLIERCCLAINLLVLTLSFALLVTFWIGKISPISLAVVGLPFIALSTYFLVIKSDLLKWNFHKSGKTLGHVIILVFLLAGGLYLRYPTGACIHGGQDHGSYFNIAAWMAEHGTYDRYDKLLADTFNQNWPFSPLLSNNPYESKGSPLLPNNPYKSKSSLQRFIHGEYEGERFNGGFTIKSRKKGHVIPQFYPLTPLLLTTSHWLFGAKQTSDILPIFGILAALGAALLSFRIWKSLFITALVLLTLLVSGLEVFFSGFPVSEIISQYFIISGLWLLLWGMEYNRSSLSLLAGLNFVSALFNHVSTIFYLGPLVGFFILYRLASQDDRFNKPVFIFYYTFLAGSTLSLISARIYNGFYVYRNFKRTLPSFESLGINGTFLVLFALVFTAAVIPGVFNTKLGKHLRGKPLWARNVLILLIALAAFSIAAKTIFYKFDLISYAAAKYTYFASITTHISPLGWFFVLCGLFWSAYRSRITLILFPALMLVSTSFIILYISFLTDYQWYFSRYYVKELYPLGIIFIAFGIYQLSQLTMLKGLKGRVVTGLFALLLILYSAHPNLQLFNKPFLKGAYEHMVSLNSNLPENSIIFLVRGPYDSNTFGDSVHRLSVPLVYSFGHDIIRLPFALSLGNTITSVKRYLNVYQRPIYLLYINAQPLGKHILPPGARLIANQVLTFNRPENAYHIPKKYGRFHIVTHLYAL